MKRNRSIERVLAWKMFFWGPEYKTLVSIIPPLSVVRLIKRDPNWDGELQLGDTFRIGYYSVQDGPNCIWLVDAAGRYNQTWDQQTIHEYFEVVEMSDETDIFGNFRPQIGPLP
ncbi:MAG: hypothetical protein ABI147_06935 [Acidobacteriaceae bacterium]